MPMTSATAPGKIILFGEHAVVYGRPAIAVPVNEVHARVVVSAETYSELNSVRIIASDIHLDTCLRDLEVSHPIHVAITGVLDILKIERFPSCTIRISSTIPVAAGLGSGAAVSVALIRALSSFLGHPLSDEQTSILSFEVEKIHHGTPSGIDNSVITYNYPIWFVKGKNFEQIPILKPFYILIGDTGVQSSTASVVADLRSAWLEQPDRTESLFERVGELSIQARKAIESADLQNLGILMNENHYILVQLGVSSGELDLLVETARKAGALGAKLSGAGRGGNMIALIEQGDIERVTKALVQQGAKNVIKTKITASLSI